MTGERNHFFGKKHSEESKNKNSISRTGKGCGENNSMNDPENRKKVSDALKIEYDSGRLDFLKKIQKDTMIKRHMNGEYISKPISSYEIKIKSILEGLGYNLETQFPINTLRYDFLLKDYNVIIEFNGDYWHCNPEKYESNYFNKKKNKLAHELWENDKIKKELAIENGYKFFTIWEKDFKKNNQEEINKIISLL
jgi:G:T-mismatch repair DNA endonuclease (very short patch repair protein)